MTFADVELFVRSDRETTNMRRDGYKDEHGAHVTHTVGGTARSSSTLADPVRRDQAEPESRGKGERREESNGCVRRRWN